MQGEYTDNARLADLTRTWKVIEMSDGLPNPATNVPPIPFLELLRIVRVEQKDGRAVFRMTIDDIHLRTLGILHGGVTATLLDTAMGMASRTLAPADHHVVTVQLNVNFTRPAWNGETVTAVGEVQHAGRQTAVVRGEMRTADDLLIATCSATMMYLPRPDGETMEKQDEPSGRVDR